MDTADQLISTPTKLLTLCSVAVSIGYVANRKVIKLRFKNVDGERWIERSEQQTGWAKK